jgi:hypothetical protein
MITIVILSCCACLFLYVSSDKTNTPEAIFWMSVLTIASFMMTAPSQPVWQALTTLQKIQFP